MGLVFVSIKEICLYPYKYVLFLGFLDPVLKMERCALCVLRYCYLSVDF